MVNMNYEIPKQETIIYGGAFNPPTRAHQAIVQACVDYAQPRGADVWLLPSGDRLDKEIGVPRERRLEYIRALASDVITRTMHIGIETSELDRRVPTETIDTVREMDERYPDRHFVWVFGSDSVATMPAWQEGEWMVDNLPMLVIDRPGNSVQSLGRNAVRLDVWTPAVSSTLVRDRLRLNETVSDLVTPSVERLLVPTGS